jgi:hypothetical protein
MFILDNTFVKSKYSNLILILIFILIICLFNVNNIFSYLTNREFINEKEKYSNIGNYNPYDKYANNYYLINEGFTSSTSPTSTLQTSMDNTSQRNYNLIINPKEKSVTIQFTGIDKNNANYNNIIGYLIILAKYNNLLEKVGHFDARITSEKTDINKILNKFDYSSSSLINTTNKPDIISLFNSDLSDSDKTSLSLLQSVFTLSLNGYNDITGDNLNVKQQLFLELLEEFYNQKYYNKSFNLTSKAKFDNNLLSLFNDLTKVYTFSFPSTSTSSSTTTTSSTITTTTSKSGFTNIDDFTDINFNDYISNYDTFKADIENEKNVDNRNKMIIKFNKEVASSLRNKISESESSSASSLDTKIKDFLIKFITKYESLTVENVNLKSSICNVDNQCQYTFSNMEDKDENGNHYYYKLGIGLIYTDSDNDNNEKISTIYSYRYGTGNNINYFKINNTLEEQTKLLQRLEEIEKNSILSNNTKITQPLIKDNDNDTKINIDAYMKMLEPHIGNYPDEFTLKEQDVRDLSLADYINKNVNMGTLNVKMNINDLVVNEPTNDS